MRVRDPYGGVIARNRLFVAFSIRYANPRRPRARGVGDVDARWSGAAPRRGRARSAAGAVAMYAAGRHVVGVRIAPVGGGAPVEAELQVTATDCQLASLVQRPGARGGLDVAVASGGPGLHSIELRPGSGRFGTPRGGRLGTVAGLPGGRSRALRASALSRGGRALRISGLPHGTTRGARAVGGRRRRGGAPLRAVGVADRRQRAAGARACSAASGFRRRLRCCGAYSRHRGEAALSGASEAGRPPSGSERPGDCPDLCGVLATQPRTALPERRPPRRAAPAGAPPGVLLVSLDDAVCAAQRRRRRADDRALSRRDRRSRTPAARRA